MSLKDLLSSLPKSSKMNCDTNFLLEVAERISEIDISSIKRNNQALEVNYSYHENDFKDENLVSSCKSIYNKLYAKNSDEKYPGWVNSITKQKYFFEEMFEWQMQTIEKIKLLQPKTILEIGAGTGILISELLPIAEQYIATDFSNEAIQFLKNKFQEEKFSAHCCSADNINNFVNGKTFNVIILNSIIQYFPSYEYFMDVFENILNFVDEGYIFIGDVKDIACLEKLKRETSGNIQDTPLEAKKNLAMAMLNDAELSFDKNLMSSLVNLFPSIISFDIFNKEGIYQTEMNKYRYDCILKIDKTRKKSPHYFSLSDKQEWCLEAAKIKLQTIFQTLIGKEVNCIFNNTNSKMMPSHSEYDVSTENADDLLKIKFQIQKIWKEILGSKNINYEENFFDLSALPHTHSRF